MAKDRYGRIGDSLGEYQRLNRISETLMILAVAVFFGGLVLPPFFVSSSSLRTNIGGGAIAVTFALLALSATVGSKAGKALPPIEDRASYCIKTAITDLDSFKVNELEAERESAVENLTRMADALDAWEVGNIRFLRELRSQLDDFRKNFRGRLIPAIQSGNKATADSVIQPLTGWANTLEMGTLDRGHFVNWNQWLTQPNPGRFNEILAPISSAQAYPHAMARV